MMLKFDNRILKIMIAIAIAMIFAMTLVQGAVPWADPTQLNRMEVNVTGATGEIDNLTHSIILNTSTVGSGFDFTNSRNNTRVYYYNSTTDTSILIYHYSDDWSVADSNATLQIRVPYFNSTADASIWIYYGDTSKSNTEDECETYIACDYFDDASIGTQWTTTDQDLVAGTAFTESSGTLSIVAGGADTWTGNDEYGSVFIDDISGDVEVQLAVNSITNTNSWTKAGIMIRNDMTAATSSTGYVFNIWRPTSGYSWQRDNNNNGYLDAHTGGGSTSIPDYLRIVKDGTTFSAYRKSLASDAWSLTGSQTMSSALTSQDIGISLTSHAGSSLATATYDNFTIRRYTTDTITNTYGSEEVLANELNISVNSPSTASVTNVQQNKTFMVNLSISCDGIDNNSDCGNVTGELRINTTTPMSLVNISDSPPAWTNNNNPLYCNLLYNTTCYMNWIVNMTGPVNGTYVFNIDVGTNETNVENVTSSNFTINIVEGNTVKFNETAATIPTFTKDSGDGTRTISVISDNGNNTNLIVSCESGDCGIITDNWVDGSSLLEGASSDVTFTCSDANSGNYSALFNLTSDEFNGKSTFNLSCNVDPIYGPISVTINEPTEGAITNVSHDQFFTLNASVNCNGTCGNISVYAILNGGSWYDPAWLYRQQINFTARASTPTGYQVLVNMTGNIGTDFSWTNSCADVRFTNSSNSDLDFWIETCNSTSNEFYAWVEIDSAITNGNDYSMFMYYGNNGAVTMSNASAVFTNDRAHLVTGRCTTTAECDMDNAAEVTTLRGGINLSTMTVDGQGYTDGIDDVDNPYGNNDAYYARYRLLYIPSSTASVTFGTYSDDDSEVSINKYDSYGIGINATNPENDVVTTQYGTWHQNNACGSTSGTQGTRSLETGKGVWIDYVMVEGGGGEDQQLCLDDGGGYNTFTSANYGGEFFARTYVTFEPTQSGTGSQEVNLISTVAGDTPLYTNISNPQFCVPGEDGSCDLVWYVNATGRPINSLVNFSIYIASNISQVSSNTSGIASVRIVNNAPLINLINPANGGRVSDNGNTNLTWFVNDTDNDAMTCYIFVNATNVANQSCSNGINFYNLSLPTGINNWSVTVNDSLNATNSTSTASFTVGINTNLRITKSIRSIAQNMYVVDMRLHNNDTIATNSILVDHTEDTFSAGSFTPFYDITYLTYGPEYDGTIYAWNLTLIAGSDTDFNYSITNASSDYELLDLFVVGLD